MEETFAQIAGAAQYSPENIDVEITDQGTITGKGVASTNAAISVCGGNVDEIIRSFGGIQGGSSDVFGKSASVIGWGEEMNSKLDQGLHEVIEKMERFVDGVESCLEKIKEHDTERLVDDLEPEVGKLKHAIHEAKEVKHGSAQLHKKLSQSKSAVHTLRGNNGKHIKAGALSLAIGGVNKLHKYKGGVEHVVHKLKTIKKGIKRMMKDCHDNTSNEHMKKHLANIIHKHSTDDMHGGDLELDTDGGALGETGTLSDRLTKQREQLREVVNKFIAEFGKDFGDIVSAMDGMAEQLGKRIDYDDKTLVFFDTFVRMKEFVDSNERNAKLHQYLLELNQNMQVDGKEVKERFVSLVRDLGERADALDTTSSTKGFAKACKELINDINKYNDQIRNLYDTMRKDGGSTDSMNELFSVDSSRINISGMLNALEKMKIAVNKVLFYRNIAIFRSNLNQTNKEIATYSKDYTKTVGKAIGEAITKIKNEYTEIINNVNDNKTGMGLEIDMYNEARPADQKISKEKLKMIYKWQCDARIGLYKTVEAIDLYLLHFTETVTKNPDAVADLQKLLSVTRAIAKWYDDKAGDNVIRVFESLAVNPAGQLVADATIDDPRFVETSYNTQAAVASADLSARIGSERAAKLYERCRRAVEGVVVLKNIISYFISISEKYGNFKGEKNIYMAPSNIYKNLVNYIWVSALDMNMMGVDVLTDTNDLKRVITYKDTEVGISKVSPIDPELLGINFNRHSIDKLRILKCHNDLKHLSQLLPSLDGDRTARLIQFVTMLFGRLGKTKYIFQMFKFGVVDLTIMDKTMLKSFVDFVQQYVVDSTIQLRAANRVVAAAAAGDSIIVRFVIGGRNFNMTIDTTAETKAALVDAIQEVEPTARDTIAIKISTAAVNDFTGNHIVSLTEFKTFSQNPRGLESLMVVRALNPDEDAFNNAVSFGFTRGLLAGLLKMNDLSASVGKAKRIVAALEYIIVSMIDEHRREYSSSVFAIDDTYFVLTAKAIAGKIMAVTGISSIFKNPNAERNTIVKSPTRLIMGGANENDEIIDDAVELYVRLPLLVEFYRRIFDNGNKKFRDLSENNNLDNEQISLVPEVGNVWSELLINIFDKSKHIDSGIYTTENMRKIVAAVNAIYKHFKGSVANDELTRHIVSELVAEVNRRYGVIKRQELLNYYKVVNATTKQNMEIDESNYSNNDLDIINEAMEFQEKSPSDEYIQDLKSTVMDKSVPTEVKINKLTDYKIVKEFRERIKGALDEANTRGRDADNTILSIRDRIRFLKRAIASKTSRQEKYDMIIKAIEESDAINQSSNDIFMCFHEFVVVPLRTLSQMHNALRLFILNVNVLLGSAANNRVVNLSPENASLVGKMADQIIANEQVLIKDNLLVSVPNTIISAPTVRVEGRNVVYPNIPNASVKLLAAMVHVINQMSANAGDLVKLNISTTKHVTVDFSEYQRVCEYLVANVKYMVDKFTGLVPTALLNKVTSRTIPDSIYNIEENLILKIFNKQNKSESARDVLCIDNLYKLLPEVAKVVFHDVKPVDTIETMILSPGPDEIAGIMVDSAMPFIRDTFAQYDKASGMYIQPSDPNAKYYISDLLFNPKSNSSFTPSSQKRAGLIQEFNIIISRYINDLYDTQSKKIYTKTFRSFAGSALVDALNGQSIKDFHFGAVPAPNTMNYHVPRHQTVLSSTLAYAMKVMINRIHPVTSVKIHDVASIQEISPHMLEKYRMLIPMYLRICKAFMQRCKNIRKIVNYINFQVDAGVIPGLSVGNVIKTVVKENIKDAEIDFAQVYESLGGASFEDAREMIPLYIDEVTNAMSSLIHDIEDVQKELLESDNTVTLYFDLKKDFTKNYLDTNKNLPFAPLSIIAMGYTNASPNTGVVPLYTASDITASKFLYGLRTMLVDNFNISSTKVPYLKKLLADFNGYSTSGNVIAEAKFNDVLKYVGMAANFIYDVRFYNGLAVSQTDMLANARPDATSMITYQEAKSPSSALSIIESVNVPDSTSKVSTFVTVGVTRDMAQLNAAIDANNTNPRARVIMVNILDLNVMPLNVHSLMREVPLTNLYNYAMTFDEIVSQLQLDTAGTPGAVPAYITKLLKQPYVQAQVVNGTVVLPDENGVINVEEQIPNSALRFINDVVNKKIVNRGVAGRELSKEAYATRLNTKLLRNIVFLTLIQYIIKKKVKRELEYVNTRVVSSTTAISDAITNEVTDVGTIGENMFEF